MKLVKNVLLRKGSEVSPALAEHLVSKGLGHVLSELPKPKKKRTPKKD